MVLFVLYKSGISMKKTLCFLLIIFVFMPLYSIEVETNLGVRLSSSGAGVLLNYDISFDNNISLGWGSSGKKIFQSSLSYYNTFGKNFFFNTSCTMESIGNDSIFSTLGGQLGIYLGKRFIFSFSLGAQGAINFIRQIDGPLFSLSPLLSLSLGFKLSRFVFVSYLKMSHWAETTWKALPVFGMKLGYIFSDNYSIFLEAWCKSAEYLMDPWVVAESGGVSFAFKVKK